MCILCCRKLFKRIFSADTKRNTNSMNIKYVSMYFAVSPSHERTKYLNIVNCLHHRREMNEIDCSIVADCAAQCKVIDRNRNSFDVLRMFQSILPRGCVFVCCWRCCDSTKQMFLMFLALESVRRSDDDGSPQSQLNLACRFSQTLPQYFRDYQIKLLMLYAQPLQMFKFYAVGKSVGHKLRVNLSCRRDNDRLNWTNYRNLGLKCWYLPQRPNEHGLWTRLLLLMLWLLFIAHRIGIGVCI